MRFFLSLLIYFSIILKAFEAYSQIIPLNKILHAKSYIEIESTILKNGFTYYKTQYDTIWYKNGEIVNKFSLRKKRNSNLNFYLDSSNQIKKIMYYKKIAGDSILIEYTQDINVTIHNREIVSAHIILKNDKIYSYLKKELIKQGFKLVYQRKARLYQTIIFKKNKNNQILISGQRYFQKSSYIYSFSTPNITY